MAGVTPGSSAQHSSSTSLMGGMELLEDLHGLAWATVLRLVFSGSSVNHLFSGEKKQRHKKMMKEGFLH